MSLVTINGGHLRLQFADYVKGGCWRCFLRASLCNVAATLPCAIKCRLCSQVFINAREILQCGTGRYSSSEKGSLFCDRVCRNDLNSLSRQLILMRDIVQFYLKLILQKFSGEKSCNSIYYKHYDVGRICFRSLHRKKFIITS